MVVGEDVWMTEDGELTMMADVVNLVSPLYTGLPDDSPVFHVVVTLTLTLRFAAVPRELCPV